MRKEADDIGPTAELEHWKERMAKFNVYVHLKFFYCFRKMQLCCNIINYYCCLLYKPVKMLLLPSGNGNQICFVLGCVESCMVPDP